MSKAKTPASSDIAVPATKRGPRNAERKAMEIATAQYEERPSRVSIEYEVQADGAAGPVPPHDDAAGHYAHLLSAFGSTSPSFMGRQLGYLEHATRNRGEIRGQCADSVNAGLAIVEAVAPQDELESALAVQMAGCHALTMEMLGRAKNSDRTDHIELFGNMAVKLQRTFASQIEALARMRGKGQQTVRVEHVTVQSGAQAIVGDVHHHAPGRGGDQSKIGTQPHGTTEFQERAALPCPDPQGNSVPISGNAKRPVSATRRTVTRRTSRKSTCPKARVLEPRDDRDATDASGDEKSTQQPLSAFDEPT